LNEFNRQIMKNKKVRVSISVDKETLRRMNLLAKRRKISRSAVAALAIQHLEGLGESRPSEIP